MPVEYELNTDIQEQVAEMLWDTENVEFEDLRSHEVVPRCCVKVKLSSELEAQPTSGSAVRLVKLNDMVRLFTEARYVIVVDGYFWQHASPAEKVRALHRALMQIQVSQTDDGLKFKTRKPDINEFSATLARLGPGPVVSRIFPILQSASVETARLMSSNQLQ